MTIVTNAVVAADALPSITYIYAARRDVAQHLTRHHLRPFHRGRAHARNRHAIAHAYVSPSLATAHALPEPQYSILPKECAHASFEPFRVSCTLFLDLRRASHELARDDYPLPLPLLPALRTLGASRASFARCFTSLSSRRCCPRTAVLSPPQPTTVETVSTRSTRLLAWRAASMLPQLCRTSARSARACTAQIALPATTSRPRHSSSAVR